MYFNTELVQNSGHLIVFLELWAHLFQENLGTCRLATNLEGTLALTLLSARMRGAKAHARSYTSRRDSEIKLTAYT